MAVDSSSSTCHMKMAFCCLRLTECSGLEDTLRGQLNLFISMKKFWRNSGKVTKVFLSFPLKFGLDGQLELWNFCTLQSCAQHLLS